MADSNSVTAALATLGPNGWAVAAPPSNYSGAVSGAGNSVAPKRDLFQTIFFAELRSTTTADFPEAANLTVTFARNFEMAGLNSSGAYVDAAHNTPLFAYVPGVRRGMLQNATAVTSIVGTTNNRDLTQSGWVKTNCTAAKDQIGLGAAANTASKLTATAASATCLFPVTTAATTRTVQAWIKRVAGSGRVWITGDGGATWYDRTAACNDTFTRVICPANGTNPSIGFMLEYSGDAISVDAVSCISSAFPANPLVNRGDSISGQTLTYAGAKPSGSGLCFSISFDCIYTDDQNVSVVLGDGAWATLSVSFAGGVQGLPAIQLLTQTPGPVVAYNTVPTYIFGQMAVSPGQTLRIRALYAGGAIQTYVNNDLMAIYDAQAPLSHDIDGSYSRLAIAGGNNTFVSNVGVHVWGGRLISILGDSLSAIRQFRDSLMAALGDEWVVLQKANGGSTVAFVRDGIAASCAYSLPSTNECWVSLWCGTNSLALGNTAAATLVELQSCINNVKAINANAKVLIPTTITNRTAGLTGISAVNFKTAAEAYNAGLSSLTGVAKIVEVNGTDLGVDTSQAGALQDGIHLKYRYYPALARKIAAATV